MPIPVWTSETLNAHLLNHSRVPALAMYSSEWGAIITDPDCMRVRVDDHLVHRGDGVFETVLCEAGALYNLSAHLRRLSRSSETIGLDCPWPESELTEILLSTFAAAEQERALGRILLGRGPGGFGVDPGQSTGPSLTVVVYEAPPPFMTAHPEGAQAILSSIPPKSGGLARVKTCNYLPNALMKAEATRAGAHFALGVDAEGYLSESYTENLAVIDAGGRLVTPPPLHHLAGTTLDRVKALAGQAGLEVTERRIRPEELFAMREVWLCGTTAYVTRVVGLDGKPLPTGPLAGQLHEALRREIAADPEWRTPLPV